MPMLTIDDSGGYRVVHLTDGSMLHSAIQLIRDQEADGLNFNLTKNFLPDIEAIAEAPTTKSIQINASGVGDWSGIRYLANLQSLQVYTKDRHPIYFNKYPKLNSAAVVWRPKAETLFECSTLRSLFVSNFSAKDLQKFSKLSNLAKLRINLGRIESLRGIEHFTQLEVLELMQIRSLTHIDGLQALKNLKLLRIMNCGNISDGADVIKRLPRVKLEVYNSSVALHASSG